ncbi:hypothetical protein HanXRQr2_Chr08g0318651 [Helianthus annuus]|uniref:Uncharacterized protein n=1 Tax=Helianthus annuus TaxID=4232 RepID=A0A9K3IBL4_HELAN|nr:hypothetical protein HanXRQr2_Chr08g0318651 [Helianthus annuus]KAJ0899945.1 hypothetical protein HanPSC8_Chr08g0307901 [Helianthus annuus]
MVNIFFIKSQMQLPTVVQGSILFKEHRVFRFILSIGGSKIFVRVCTYQKMMQPSQDPKSQHFSCMKSQMRLPSLV